MTKLQQLSGRFRLLPEIFEPRRGGQLSAANRRRRYLTGAGVNSQDIAATRNAMFMSDQLSRMFSPRAKSSSRYIANARAIAGG